jgi:HSP20 family protein
MNAVAKQANKTNAPIAAESERTFVSPDVNIYESETGYVLEAEMPGVSKDRLEVSLENNTLTILGHREDDMSSQTQVLYRESKPADFRRVFELDPAVDTVKIRAQMDQGVLTLDLPKTEAVKPRKIAVE